MTADRLREAELAMSVIAHVADKQQMHSLLIGTPLYKAAQRLLQATEAGHGVKCWCQGDLVIDARCAAALDLADVILGGAK